MQVVRLTFPVLRLGQALLSDPRDACTAYACRQSSANPSATFRGGIRRESHRSAMWRCLTSERLLVHDRHSPAYYGDAKNLDQYEGLAEPVELFVTRSEIDDVSQRTAEGQLFTYQFYAPYTKEKQPHRVGLQR